MTENFQKESVAERLEKVLAKSKKTVLAVVIVAVVAIAVVAVISAINAKADAAGIEKIDTITYVLTKDAENLAGDELAQRQNEALEQLNGLASKSGITGIRANMLVADIKFAQKNFEEARTAYVKAAAGKKAYTAAISNFNAGVCSEELNDADSAVKFYKAASDYSDFVLIDHALFSLGRVYETKAAYADAKAAYEKLTGLHPTSNWGQLAKSRLIALKADGNIQ